ncbi:hypothetical protein BpHYR1_013599 [Brachionus plicatilis]|uniref:Uncharacterized protein n=1 Tax=Brachionus plicatilis TaxID=10195 RepID=A0A3M7R0N1_BRAPC|nr:hypothetical protein BpHYR1_013599 [Brachionus plicatilis]
MISCFKCELIRFRNCVDLILIFSYSVRRKFIKDFIQAQMIYYIQYLYCQSAADSDTSSNQLKIHQQSIKLSHILIINNSNNRT